MPIAALKDDSALWDLAITDYDMPGMNGAQLARALRKTRPDLPDPAADRTCPGFTSLHQKQVGLFDGVLGKPASTATTRCCRRNGDGNCQRKVGIMRILIADDHELLRDVLRSYLEAEGGFTVETVADLPAALEMIGACDGGFDLVVLDYGMPGMDGLSGPLSGRLPPMAAAPGRADVGPCPARSGRTRAGGRGGRLHAQDPARPLAGQCDPVHGRGRDVYAARPPPALAIGCCGAIGGPCPRAKREVLSGLCAGHANKEIARDLNLREPTIKLHVKLICRKLGARNRTHCGDDRARTGAALNRAGGSVLWQEAPAGQSSPASVRPCNRPPHGAGAAARCSPALSSSNRRAAGSVRRRSTAGKAPCTAQVQPVEMGDLAIAAVGHGHRAAFRAPANRFSSTSRANHAREILLWHDPSHQQRGR